MGDIFEPTTEAELRTALREIFREASSNGIHISENRWVIDNEETDIQGWEVECVPIAEE